LKRLTYHDRATSITVKDAGIGIAVSEQSRIFDRFDRINSDRSRETGGTGLGLAIAQTIAHLHNGQIVVKREIGQGSIFTVNLSCFPQ
jgi:two-component system, OmpR family, Ni(II)-sensor and/or redox sensor kinase NrsS